MKPNSKNINRTLKIINKKIEKKDIKAMMLFFTIVIALTLLIKILFFYRGVYFAPKKTVYDLNISIVSPVTEFTDIFEKTKGTVLFDLAHENNFTIEEIDVLISRIIARGNNVGFLTDENLDSKLRKANSLVIILPKKEFTDKELILLKEFIDKNGKLLLISDPDRESKINLIAGNFNIIFSQDYLYNQKENDGNFKFIFLKEFKNNEMTKKLKKISLYTSCPILPFDNGIAFSDRNTFSSSEETKIGFTPIIFKSHILAICDITFFEQPYNIVANNNQLISNIADYLTKPDKGFSLVDFPYFFRENISVVTTNLGLSEHAINLKSKLLKADIYANISRSLNKDIDAIVIELFDDFRATQIQNLVVDEDSFRINNLLFSRKGSSLVYLEKGNTTILTILADTEKVLGKTLDLLDIEELRNNLVDDNTAVISGLGVEQSNDLKIESNKYKQ